MEDELKCPKCRSTHVSANKKGFSGKNAAVGALLTGGVGLLAGTVGSNKVRITCLMCGFEFEPGYKAPLPVEPIPFKNGMLTIILPVTLIILVFFLILHFAGFLWALIFGIIVLVVGKVITS